MVIASSDGNDVLLCQITSKFHSNSIILTKEDFIIGNLVIDSFIRPNKLFTADINIIIKKVGTINKNKLELVINDIINFIKTN